MPLRDVFEDDYKQASVVSVDLRGKRATLDNGEEERFTHLVLAVGVSVSYPSTTDLKSLPELKDCNTKVASDVSTLG